MIPSITKGTMGLDSKPLLSFSILHDSVTMNLDVDRAKSWEDNGEERKDKQVDGTKRKVSPTLPEQGLIEGFKLI